mgnify:CR=1 FL=1
MSNHENQDFDLFAANEDDHLQEFLNKKKYKWTNKFTAVFGVILLVIGSASAGAWYGYKQGQTSSSTNSFGNFGNFRSQFGNNAGGNNSGGNGGNSFGGNNFGGNQGSTRTGGTSSTLATPIPTSSSKVVAGSASTKTNTRTSTTASARPSISGGAGNGGRRAGFADNPELQACLKKAGITLDANNRPNFQDTKVRDAFQQCAQSLGLSFGGGQRNGGNGGAGGGNNGATSGSANP